MQTLRRQRGITMMSLVALLVLIGFVTIMGVRLVPIYLEYWRIAKVAESVQQDRQLAEASIREIRQALSSRLTLNNVRDRNVNEIYQIQQRDGSLAITVSYEERRHLIFNLDVVASFERRYAP